MPLPAAYPTALDALANPTATTNRDDPGFELDEVVSRIHDILEALEAKVGIGASLPSTAAVLRRTAPGTTAWGQVQNGDVVGGGTANTVLRTADGTTVSWGMAHTLLASAGPLVSPTNPFDFTSIPSTYRHLRLYLWVRSAVAATSDTIYLRFNGITSASYYDQTMSAIASAAIGSELRGAVWNIIGGCPGNSANANQFGLIVVEFAPSSGVSSYRGWASHGGLAWGTATGEMQTRSAYGWLESNAAINRITVGTASGSNLAIGSSAALYGLN